MYSFTVYIHNLSPCTLLNPNCFVLVYKYSSHFIKRIDSNSLEMRVANSISRKLLLLEMFPHLFFIMGTIVVSIILLVNIHEIETM